MTGIDPQLAATLPIEEGTLIAGKYRVVGLLAAGGMGAVVKARHEVLEQDVAIKLMRPELMNDREAAQRFLREARAAAKISSDYVARVSDVDLLDDGTPFMVMEFLQGEDLDAVLAREGEMSVRQAVDYALQALSGLDAAHRLGVVHRDLKPSNLFLVTRPDGSRRVKLLDFGISKVLDQRGSGGLKAGATTSSDAVLGTPRYMSPEQVSSAKDVDGRTDIWALGLILYQLLTNYFPFEGDTAGAVLANVLTAKVPSVEDLRPDVPPLLAEAVMRCLQRDRDRRYANVRALMVAIGPYASRRIRALLLDADETPPAITNSQGTPKLALAPHGAMGDTGDSSSDLKRDLGAVDSQGATRSLEHPVSSSSSARHGPDSVDAATAPTLHQHAPDTVTNMELELSAGHGNRRFLVAAVVAILLAGGGVAWWVASDQQPTAANQRDEHAAAHGADAANSAIAAAPEPPGPAATAAASIAEPAPSADAAPITTAAHTSAGGASSATLSSATSRVPKNRPPPYTHRVPLPPPAAPPPPPPSPTPHPGVLGTRE